MLAVGLTGGIGAGKSTFAALLAGRGAEDPGKLAALNAIVHPVILQRIADDLEKLSRTDAVVVVDAALITELGLREALDAVIVVTTSRQERVDRLVRTRGMSIDDITARM